MKTSNPDHKAIDKMMQRNRPEKRAMLQGRRRNQDRGQRIIRCMGCGGDRVKSEECGHCGYRYGDGYEEAEGDF